MTIIPNPTLFESREASGPYSRGQWDSALKATPHSRKSDVWFVGALEPTACSTAHDFQSRHPRVLLTTLNYCRIKVCLGSFAVHSSCEETVHGLCRKRVEFNGYN